MFDCVVLCPPNAASTPQTEKESSPRLASIYSPSFLLLLLLFFSSSSSWSNHPLLYLSNMFDFSPPLFLSSFMLNSLSKPRKKDRCTKNEARSAGASLYGSYFAIHYHTIQSNEQAESYQATTDSQHPAATTSGTITNVAISSIIYFLLSLSGHASLSPTIYQE